MAETYDIAEEFGDPFAPQDNQRDASTEMEDRMLAQEVRRLRVHKRAQEIVRNDDKPQGEPFDAGTLAEILARPAEPLARVDGLIPWQASTLIVAQRKTGKSTLVLNLARCLMTGEPCLGTMPVRPIAQDATVAMLNYEVSAAQIARWADDAGVPADRLYLVNLRGRRNPLAHPDDRARLAELLRARKVETLIVDPFGRAYTGESQNDAGQVGAWLTGLSEFARAEVGALDVILTAHAGWEGERSRGSTALEDWPDAIVTLTRDDSGDRFIRATGRDVDLDEDRLTFDPATRTLRLSGTDSRKAATKGRHLAELSDAVISIVREHGPLNGSQIDEHLRNDGVPHQKGEHSKVPAQAVENGSLTMKKGQGPEKIYELPRTTPNYPELPRTIPPG
jgi:AAA domain